MNEKLNELLKDEAVAKELVEQESIEDAQKFLAGKGVEVSVEEIEDLRKAVAVRAEGGEELDDEQLEQVAGGANINKAQFSLLQDFINRRW
jgi:hypothetical protein